MKTGFTLQEMLVVIIIIGILAILALSQYGSGKERALDKEAIANLKLVSAAERIYRMEANFYYPYTGDSGTGTTGITNINTYLRLSLPAGTNRNWDYYIYSGGTSGFDARGARYNQPSGWARRYKMGTTEGTEEPCCICGNCPPGMSNCPGGPCP